MRAQRQQAFTSIRAGSYTARGRRCHKLFNPEPMARRPVGSTNAVGPLVGMRLRRTDFQRAACRVDQRRLTTAIRGSARLRVKRLTGNRAQYK